MSPEATAAVKATAAAETAQDIFSNMAGLVASSSRGGNLAAARKFAEIASRG